MDSFEFNKIAGAVLATALGVMAISIVSEMIFEPPHDAEPGMIVAVAEEGEGGGGAVADEVAPIAVRLASADLGAGERSLSKCRSCHVFAEGDLKSMPGPNLYGVVGGPVAHLEGYAYSAAFQEKHAEGMTWTFENIDAFLEAPSRDIPGTKMTFAGLKRPDERANVIAYLNTLSANPLPLPAPEATTAEVPAAPAGETPAAPAPDAPAPANEPALPPAAAEPPPALTTPEPPATQVPDGQPAVPAEPSAQ